MGNSTDKDNFYMHVKIIGDKINSFYDNLNNSEFLKSIKKFWDIEPIDNNDNLIELNKYFDNLNELIEKEDEKAQNLRECLIVQVKNNLSKEINIILQQMNNILETYNMPLILLLTTEKCEKNLNINKEKYKNIDPRLIFIKDYQEDKSLFEEEIAPLLVRFCSIHNDLGDEFKIGDNAEETYNLIGNDYPFNLNIACIGTAGQGKSTGVNELLNDYKAKESNNGCSQTKKLPYYQVEQRPIRILDIPGFEGMKSVKEVLEKFKECGQPINRIRKCIHIILYFFNYSKVKETRSMGELEYPMFEEITKHKSSRLIYVITRSKKDLNDNNKKQIYKKINLGLRGTKNQCILNNMEKLKANDNNVVFVNFRKDENNLDVFGKKELFKKIHDFFIESDSYKESLKNEGKALEDEIEKLKASARDELYPTKFKGALAGIIPFGDLLLQKFVIKKEAIKKVGEKFGIEAKFVDEDNTKEKEYENKKIKEIKEEEKKIEKENKEEVKIEGINIISDFFGNPEDKKEEKNNIENNIKNENIIKEPDYIKPDIDKKNLIKISDGEKLIKDSTKNNVAEFVGGAIQATAFATEAGNVSKFINHSSTISNLVKQADKLSNAYEVIEKLPKSNGFNPFAIHWTNEIAEVAYDKITDEIDMLTKAGSGAKLFRFFGIGTVINVGIGYYCTHNFCENLINKFADYYRKNASKITIAYEHALSYFNEFKS